MGKTAQMVMKIIGASLAFAAVVCLIIGSWNDFSDGCSNLRTKRMRDDFDDQDDANYYF